MSTLDVHIAVHRLCTARGDLPGSAPRAGSDYIPAGQRLVREEDRAVRRSVDRRGRPARRDPVVRRGATATLTASSTARQRCPGTFGRVADDQLRRVAEGVEPAGWTMGGRDPTGSPVVGRP